MAAARRHEVVPRAHDGASRRDGSQDVGVARACAARSHQPRALARSGAGRAGGDDRAIARRGDRRGRARERARAVRDRRRGAVPRGVAARGSNRSDRGRRDARGRHLFSVLRSRALARAQQRDACGRGRSRAIASSCWSACAHGDVGLTTRTSWCDRPVAAPTVSLRPVVGRVGGAHARGRFLRRFCCAGGRSISCDAVSHSAHRGRATLRCDRVDAREGAGRLAGPAGRAEPPFSWRPQVCRPSGRAGPARLAESWCRSMCGAAAGGKSITTDLWTSHGPTRLVVCVHFVCCSSRPWRRRPQGASSRPTASVTRIRTRPPMAVARCRLRGMRVHEWWLVQPRLPLQHQPQHLHQRLVPGRHRDLRVHADGRVRSGARVLERLLRRPRSAVSGRHRELPVHAGSWLRRGLTCLSNTCVDTGDLTTSGGTSMTTTAGETTGRGRQHRRPVPTRTSTGAAVRQQHRLIRFPDTRRGRCGRRCTALLAFARHSGRSRSRRRMRRNTDSTATSSATSRPACASAAPRRPRGRSRRARRPRSLASACRSRADRPRRRTSGSRRRPSRCSGPGEGLVEHRTALVAGSGGQLAAIGGDHHERGATVERTRLADEDPRRTCARAEVPEPAEHGGRQRHEPGPQR